MELAPAQRETLKNVCDALFPGDPKGTPFWRRKGSDMGVDSMLADAAERLMQPGNSRDLRRVLSAMDSRTFNLALTGRPVRFSSMGQHQRERYLAAWRDSPIPLKRTAFQALKRLTLFLAYASLGPDGTNPNWGEIGYPGGSPDPPTPTPEALRLSPIRIDSDTTLSCDAVIVGSGAGGSVIARQLAEAGYDVLVIEQGHYDTSETFQQNEAAMMQKLFQQSGTAATRDLSYVLLAGRGAGGGTTVNWNTCLRPPGRVLREWESDFGIDGVAGAGFSAYLDDVWRSIRASTEESRVNGNNSVLADGCKALGFAEGTDYHVIERNAVGCDGRCDFCGYGCRYAAKQSTAVTYLPAAQARGARFVFDARVERVVIEGGAAKGVVAVCTGSGTPRRLEVRARAVVVASGGIETPALLLRSGVRDRGVGKHLRLDPTAAVGGIFDRPIEPWKGPPQTVAVWKYIDLDGTYHGFWVEAAPAHPGLFALAAPWEGGREHKEFMAKNYTRSAASIVLLRERSEGEVSVGADGYARVDYSLGKKDQETMMRGMEETARILAAAGATGIWTTHSPMVSAGGSGSRLTPSDLDSFAASLKQRGMGRNRLVMFSAHIMGSCRMSADPSEGPTSPGGELHSVRNLFIGDACVFPTTPAVNPMVSIMAMAMRTGETIKRSLRSEG